MEGVLDVFGVHFLELLVGGEEAQYLYGAQHYLLEFFDHLLDLHAGLFEVLQLEATLLDVAEHLQQLLIVSDRLILIPLQVHLKYF